MRLGRFATYLIRPTAIVATLVVTLQPASAQDRSDTILSDPRPLALIEQMIESPLKAKLRSCSGDPIRRTLFSISHRGAPLGYPEHTVEGYQAAAHMGAGIVECDVTFTSDKELVCRHAQNDLSTTTNILTTDLAKSCVGPFQPASAGTKAAAECRTSEITLAEFHSLTGKRDGFDATALTAKDFQNGPVGPRLLQGANDTGILISHRESISLFKSLGVKFTPELKSPAVTMPFDGFSQQDYAQKLIDAYKAEGVPASDVWVQSFDLKDILYWIEHEPDFGAQAVYLDGRYSRGIDPNDPATFKPSMADLKAMGVNYIAPPIWMLLTLRDDEIIPSAYAQDARNAGLELITWTLERSGPLNSGGGWYYQSVSEAIDGDGRLMEVLDVLAQDVGVVGVFSDWPATVSYYASCMGLK
ncbi:glycerophosphodiester phosphodiesterase family protein [bacterium]|nr:glycerophosphodiester phosphodiesterase family protein [bacterium]